MKLINKIAVITGAGKGIGKATAKLFLKEGADLILTSRNKQDLELFVSENEEYKNKITIIAGDISKESTIEKIRDITIEKYNRIDILVNNAGFGIFDNMIDSRLEDFDAIFSTNVRAVYLLTKQFLPYMIKEQSGTIINISSIAGKQGFATGTIYCASKHAVMGLSRALMLEVRKYNIRVAVICPGSIATDFFRAESKTNLTGRAETVLQAEEIAETILLTASLPNNATISELEIRPTNPKS
jgi:3-oxoacyl-[acyl-carrier protein] reductase